MVNLIYKKLENFKKNRPYLAARLEDSIELFGRRANAVALENSPGAFVDYLRIFNSVENYTKDIDADKLTGLSPDSLSLFLKAFYKFRPELKKSKLKLDVFEIDNKRYLLPYYTLVKVGARTVAGIKRLPALLRDDKGDIKAIPKLGGEKINRTCYIPSLGLEAKGIGTIEGKPKGEYNDGWAKPHNPVGGLLLPTAGVEFFTDLYLYLAGIDVPEPIAVKDVKEKVRGRKIGIYFRKVKTPFRGYCKGWFSKTKTKEARKARRKAFKEIGKINYLGLIHGFFYEDNYNLKGQVLDGGERIAELYAKTKKIDDYKIMNENWDMCRLRKLHRIMTMALWRNKKIDVHKGVISLKEDSLENILKNAEILYEEVAKQGVRLIPMDISLKYGELFLSTEGKKVVGLFKGKKIKKKIIDPRIWIGSLGKLTEEEIKKLKEGIKGSYGGDYPYLDRLEEKAKALYQRYISDGDMENERVKAIVAQKLNINKFKKRIQK